MLKDGKICVANNDKGENIFILPKMANRHGLIAGATGTVLFYTTDGSDPAKSDTRVNAAANTATVNFSNLAFGGKLRVVAVPTNNANFISDEAEA